MWNVEFVTLVAVELVVLVELVVFALPVVLVELVFFASVELVFDLFPSICLAWMLDLLAASLWAAVDAVAIAAIATEALVAFCISNFWLLFFLPSFC